MIDFFDLDNKPDECDWCDDPLTKRVVTYDIEEYPEFEFCSMICAEKFQDRYLKNEIGEG